MLKKVLSENDIEHFVIYGYIRKEGVLDARAVEQAIDVVWANLPPPYQRDAPETWGSPIHDCRGNMDIGDRFGLVKFRKEIITDERVAAITTRNSSILAMAAQLLGADRMEPPRKFRGLYPIFPTPELSTVQINGHIDETPEKFRLSVGVYLNRIPADGGALMLWPKSHRSLHFAARTTGCTYDDLATPDFLQAFHAWNRTDPVSLAVEPGDVVFFHNRLLHGPGINSRPGHVRLASYFNVRARNEVSDPPGGLWDGWNGITATGSEWVRKTNLAPATMPKFSRYSSARRGLPLGGAHGDFARKLERQVNRRQSAETAFMQTNAQPRGPS